MESCREIHVKYKKERERGKNWWPDDNYDNNINNSKRFNNSNNNDSNDNWQW